MEAKAKQIATFWHNSINQKRKYSGEPYIVHPAAVVEIVRSVPHTEAMLCAAWLHETIEDTPYTMHELWMDFGSEVADLVEQLTNTSKRVDGNRAFRKELDRKHTSLASPRAKTIKLADRLDNCKDLQVWDDGFRKVYVAETRLLLEVLKEGDSSLWYKLNGIITDEEALG